MTPAAVALRRALNTSATRGALAGMLLVASLAGLAAWVRLLPWMFAADVPWRVLLPFGRLLAASVVEVGLLVGAPIGLLQAWHVRAQAGELTALLALGCRPARLAWSQLPSLLVCALPALVFAAWVSGTTQAAPARVLGQLVRAGEVACAGGSEPLARIPVGGLVQDCDSGWLVGALPTGAGWFATQRAAAPALGASLEGVELGRTQLFFPPSQRPTAKLLGGALGAVQIEVDQATIRGLPHPPVGRRGLVRGISLLLAVGLQVLWVGLVGDAGRALRRASLGALTSSLLALSLLTLLDRSAAPAWMFLGLPAGVGSLWILGVGSLRWRCLRRS